METLKSGKYYLLMGGLMLITLSGCATVDRKVSLLYRPVTETRVGSGELLLADPHAGKEPIAATVQWIIGKVKNNDGETVGNIVSTMSPEMILLDAFKQELTTAGYTVSPATALPKHASKGVAVSQIVLSMTEEASIPKDEANATLSVTVELWKNGQKIRQLTYESRISDFAVMDRSLLPGQVLERTLHQVMKQAVPEIASALER